MTVRRLLEHCEADRQAEVTLRQQSDERLRQVLEGNRMLTAQVEQAHHSPAVQLQVGETFLPRDASAERGNATVSRLSVRLSVCLSVRDV